MKKFGLVFVSFFLFFLSQAFSFPNAPAGYQYIFPEPGAKHIHPSTTIILRFENISPGV